MDLQEIFVASVRNVLFGLVVLVLALPLLLSVPLVRDYLLSAVSLIGIGE